jgi:hypothetical protein
MTWLRMTEGPVFVESMLILVANEPQSYREVISASLQHLRSHHRIVMVDPSALDREVIRQNPELVVCSTLSSAVQTYPLTWILLYPEGKSEAVISMADHMMTFTDLELTNLLSVIDHTAGLSEPGS